MTKANFGHADNNPLISAIKNLDEILQEEPMIWLVPHLIAGTGVSFLGGPTKTGKSVLAARVVTWLASSGTRILYFCGEGRRGQVTRMRALCSDAEWCTIRENTVFIGEPVPMLGDAAYFKHIQELIDEHSIDLVVIDTLQKYKGAVKEDSNDEVGVMVTRLGTLTCPSWIIMHFGKDTTKGFRGASAFINDCMAGYSTKKTGKHTVHIICEKVKDDEELNWKFEFEIIESHGMSVPAVSDEWWPPAPVTSDDQQSLQNTNDEFIKKEQYNHLATHLRDHFESKGTMSNDLIFDIVNDFIKENDYQYIGEDLIRSGSHWIRTNKVTLGIDTIAPKTWTLV